MDDQVFVKTGNGMKPVARSQYEKEDILQRLVAEYPELLAGVTTNGDDDVELLLVGREIGIPAIGRVGAYSIDHVFVDRDATPILVEVKRSSDTRIRREMVGQLVDYAAFAPRSWTAAKLQAAFVASNGPGATLPRTWSDGDVDGFFQRVHRRLTNHDMRLVFVADQFPEEVVTVIEFLNEQMKDVEVLGVEVATYQTGPDDAVLVPRVIGRTSEAVATKASGGGRSTPWTSEELLAAAQEKHEPMVVQQLKQLIEHGASVGAKQNWGSGTSPGFSSWYSVEGQVVPVLTANAGTATPGGRAYMQVYLPKIRPHVSDKRFLPFTELLVSITELGRDVPVMAASGFTQNYASAYLDLMDVDGISQLLAAIDLLRDPDRASGEGVRIDHAPLTVDVMPS